MKKVLIAFDGLHFSQGALEMAGFLNSQNPVLLTGAFLPQVSYASLWSYSGGGKAANVFIPMAEDDEAAAVKENIERFKAWCVKKGIEHRVHQGFLDFTLPELKKESRFADLLIIGSESFYEDFGAGVNEYLKDALHDVECPVMVVPEKFEWPQTNVLAYDGSASSVYAIRQFACLLPELTANSTVLIYTTEKKDKEFPDEENIKELAARHFPDLSLLKFEAPARSFFATWLMEKKGAILVTGAFGRSGLSRFFRRSFITEILKEHRLPVFIAHQ